MPSPPVESTEDDGDPSQFSPEASPTSPPGGPAGYLRSLKPELPASVWTVILGVAISSVGNGFVLPFGSIYLHVVRGLPIPLVGVIISTTALASLVAGAVGGSMVDRLGPRTMMLGGLLLQAVGYLGFGFATSAATAAVSMLLIGAGLGCFYPSMASLLAAVTNRTQRSAAAALQYAATNLGIGVGAVIGGLIVSTSSPSSFTTIYLVDAVSFLLFGVLVITLVPSGRHRAEGHERPSYRVVLRDRTFLALIAFNAVLVLSTYAQLETSVPLYARVFLGVPTVALGIILAANTAFIVLAQLPISRAVRHLNRSRTLALSASAWLLAWLIGEVASLTHGLTASLLLGVFAVCFGLGECLLSATIGPLVADLAPAAVRGRYMAAFNLSWGVGLLIGPTVGGLVIGSVVRPGMWFLWAAVAAGLVVFAERLGRRLPASANRGPLAKAP
ncbi:MAG TPA: MFS transporter [Candidatus Dormibacteraeota bacterium]|nr:MFS transporter [Candidatus Dormibacteraeota bacterium]